MKRRRGRYDGPRSTWRRMGTRYRRGWEAEHQCAEMIRAFPSAPHVAEVGDFSGPDLIVNHWLTVEVKGLTPQNFSRSDRPSPNRVYHAKLRDFQRGAPLDEDILVLRLLVPDFGHRWFVIPCEIVWGCSIIDIPCFTAEAPTLSRSKYAKYHDAWHLLQERLDIGHSHPDHPPRKHQQTYASGHGIAGDATPENSDVPF